jgi:hypothetical protein
LPFTLLNITFDGEKPLNPIGYIFSILIFCFIIYYILYLFEIKITPFNQKSLFRKIIDIIIYLYILLNFIFPFIFELDFF